MKITLRNVILSLVVFSSLFISCESNQDRTKLTEKVTEAQEEKILNPEEQEIKAIVEKLLMLVGNSDFQGLDSIISDKANLASAIIRDGASKNSVITIGEYFESQKNRERKPFYEPVYEYKILINKGQIAFVWADAILHSYGVPRTNNIDNFTLIKEDGKWQFINISFTNTPLPEELKKFDLEVFAKSYAQVWCSQRPNFVSSFFSENGVLQINDGSPAKGTEEITNVVKGFMDAFPNMVVSMDSLTTKLDKTRFYWTLTGTNNGLNGTGNKVKISGFEEWTLNKDGLIQESKGYFDQKEYNRQFEFKSDK
ncbi:ester cyclase [uncultured Maribacter sp.]|uniref:ester cyclase n=1 Tax=uncultured Maribacter sp. TaxID=431308 RepID=UPI0030D773AB|tara:strand:+ start:10572 stop:11504 length:933 start_codon:yes stop_codon:yes gene_type:complete